MTSELLTEQEVNFKYCFGYLSLITFMNNENWKIN